LPLLSSWPFKFSLIAILTKSSTIIASVLVFTLSGVLFENTSLRAAFLAHIHGIRLLDFTILGHVVRAVIFEVLFVLLELLEQFVIADFTQTLSSISFSGMTASVLHIFWPFPTLEVFLKELWLFLD